MFSKEIHRASKALLKALKKKKQRICTAESCTAGLISAALTEVPGSSDVFERGYVTYSNASKIELLTVPTFYMEDYGAVSMETVAAMAEGALLMSKAYMSIAVTGIAGPDGGTEEKPVGTVYIATSCLDQETLYERHQFEGDRSEVRMQTVLAALNMALDRLDIKVKTKKEDAVAVNAV
jgi:nicotinamide-nucleotide amidase